MTQPLQQSFHTENFVDLTYILSALRVPAGLTRYDARFSVLSLDEGETAPAGALYLVLNGEVQVTQTVGRHSRVTEFVGPRGLAGLASLYSPDYSVTAMTYSRVVLIPKRAVIAGQLAEFNWMLPLLAEAFAAAQAMETSARFYASEQRLVKFLLERSDLQIRLGFSGQDLVLNQKRPVLASYLAFNNETLSRALHALQWRGLIEISGNRGHQIKLVDLPGLRRVLEA